MSESDRSTTAGPPSKKRRKSSEEGPTQSRFWFNDGNVILEAENTQFRVHRSVLSNHSAVFNDMFELSQPDERPLIEGCPIIQLSDSREDVESMICMFYDNTKAFDFKQGLPFPVVAMMIRLGRKYQIEHFVKDAMDRLHHDYPATKRQWLALQNGVPHLIKDTPGLAFHVVNLAHQFSLQTILTAAYANLLYATELEDILRGIRLTNDTHLHLDPTALVAVVLGRDQLIKNLPDSLAKFSLVPSQDRDDEDCEDARDNHTLHIGKNLPIGMLVDPHSYLVTFAEMNLCSICEEVITLMGTKWNTWKSLPKCFNVPPWDDQTDFHL